MHATFLLIDPLILLASRLQPPLHLAQVKKGRHHRKS
jgi:hypothetical protein